MGEVDAVAFDKTGTLTKGELTVTDVVPLNGNTEEDVLRCARGLEARSEHPIGEAIVARSGRARTSTKREIDDFESHHRQGRARGPRRHDPLRGQTRPVRGPRIRPRTTFTSTTTGASSPRRRPRPLRPRRRLSRPAGRPFPRSRRREDGRPRRHRRRTRRRHRRRRRGTPTTRKPPSNASVTSVSTTS